MINKNHQPRRLRRGGVAGVLALFFTDADATGFAAAVSLILLVADGGAVAAGVSALVGLSAFIIIYYNRLPPCCVKRQGAAWQLVIMALYDGAA